MPHPNVTASAGTGGFVLEAHPATSGAELRSAIKYTCASRSGLHFTPAGMAAVIAAVAAYYTAAKITTVNQRIGAIASPRVVITSDGFALDVPAEDVSTLNTTFTAILQTAANLTAIR